MRDPELVARAERAAARLESAWERWRALQGIGETPAQPVVGYVGYALKEPWGQPRAVIGFSADEAERLAEFLERGSGDRAVIELGAADRALAVTSQLSGSQHRHSFLPGSGVTLKMSGLGTARPRPEPRLLLLSARWHKSPSYRALSKSLPPGGTTPRTPRSC
jgi:hypothetical protein